MRKVSKKEKQEAANLMKKSKQELAAIIIEQSRLIQGGFAAYSALAAEYNEYRFETMENDYAKGM